MWFLNVFDMTLGHGLVLHYRYGGHDFDMALTWFPWIVSDMNLIFDIWCSVCSVCFFHGLGTQWLFWGSWWVGLKKGHRNTWYNFDTVLIQFWKKMICFWYDSKMCSKHIPKNTAKIEQAEITALTPDPHQNHRCEKRVHKTRKHTWLISRS